jgi:hypothetical protein
VRDWNDRDRLCGNCRYWPLAGYQHDWEGCEPSGIGGHATDGSVSDCRRNAPAAVQADRYPSATALWPQTEKTACCGEFELRPATHRRSRS